MSASRSLMIESDSKDSYGPEGSREENATNPTTAGLPMGSGVVQALPTSNTPEASGRLRERLSSRERFAHPAAVREASLVGIETRAEIEAKPRGPDSISARVRVGSPLPPILSTRSQGRRGIARRPHVQYLHPGVAGMPPSPVLYLHRRFLGPIFYKWRGRRDAVTFNRRG